MHKYRSLFGNQNIIYNDLQSLHWLVLRGNFKAPFSFLSI